MTISAKRAEIEPHYIAATSPTHALAEMRAWGWQIGKFGSLFCGINPDGEPVIMVRREIDVPVDRIIYLARGVPNRGWVFEKVKAHIIAGGAVKSPELPERETAQAPTWADVMARAGAPDDR